MDDDLNQLSEQGKVELLEPLEGAMPPEAATFSAKAQRDKFLSGARETEKTSGINLQRATQAVDAERKTSINEFLNGASGGNDYVWTDKKYDFYLGKDNYYCYFSEGNEGEVQAGLDAELMDDVVNLFRMRVDKDASRRYFEESGKTFGQEMFDSALAELKGKGAKQIYAEVTPDGYKFFKRMGEAGKIGLTEDTPPATPEEFGLIRATIA